MSATYDEATDDMVGVIKTAWDTTGFGANADYQAVPGYVPPDDVPWIRVAIRTANGNTASLSNTGGRRRYVRTGTLFTQLFIPSGTGLSQGNILAKTLSDALEGKQTEHCVIFRNVRINEIGASGKFYQINVLADFVYDEFK